MPKIFVTFLTIAGLALIIASQSLFIVDQTQQAIVLQFGQPVGFDSENPEQAIKRPGLHWKIPVIQNVRYFDSRILSVDPRPEQVVISSDSLGSSSQSSGTDNQENLSDITSIDRVTGEPIVLDTFARYKITDPLQFLKTLRTIGSANSRLSSILIDATKAELGKTTLQQLLSPARAEVMINIQNRVNKNVTDDRLGIEIVDVRIVRADLTPELRTSTVRRMISELKERATETRAKGEELALEIRSTAEKEREIILAEAQRDAEIIKGQGDNEAIKIYADAFNKDRDFYGFIRSMDAYKNTLADPNTQLILTPDSEFLRFFKSAK